MKKSKLILSVMSLCFAMAMLTYGIFAATSVSYSIRGKVSYTVTDAYVEVVTTVYKKTSPLEGTLQALVNTAVNDVSSLTQVEESDPYSSAGGQNGSFDYEDLAFSTSENPAYAYIFVINVKNLSSDINVWAAVKGTLAGPENTTVATNKCQPLIGVISGNNNPDNKNIIVGITVAAWETNVTVGQNNNFSFEVDIGSSTMPSEYEVNNNEMANDPENLAKLQFEKIDNKQEVSVQLNNIAADVSGRVIIPSSYTISGVSYPVTVLESAQPKQTELPNGAMVQNVAGAGEYDFTEIIVPNSVKTIEDGALAYCPNLERVTLPFVGTENNLKSGKESLFGYIFEESAEEKEGYYIATQCYYNNQDTNFLIPESLTEVTITDAEVLPYGAFSYIRDIDIYFEDACTFDVVDGDYSPGPGYGPIPFRYSTVSIKKWPQSLTTIGRYAFCYSTFTSFEIPNTVTTIGSVAFRYCSNLESIVIPNTVTTIGSGAFEDCTGLVSVELPNNMRTIGDNIFYDCTALTTVNFPSTLQTICNYTFGGCTSLANVQLPQSLKEIQCGAFSRTGWKNNLPANEKGLKIVQAYDNPNVKFLIDTDIDTISPNITADDLQNVKIIAGDAFSDCTALRNVVIPDSVISIGGFAFYNCENLQSVTFGQNMEIVEFDIFIYCSNLTMTELVFGENLKKIGGWIMPNYIDTLVIHATDVPEITPRQGPGVRQLWSDNSTGLIYVPDESVDAYKAAANWSQYADRIKPISELA